MHLDTGIIECIAGVSMAAGYTGDGGPAMTATFNWPLGITIGPDHNLYVADELNNAIRKIEISNGVAGNVTTIVGNGNACMTSNGQCPERALATDLELNAPYSMAFDPAGDMYVADTQNNRVVRVLMP
jgi:DNA-binding beta-propeller fold protein YncE